MSCRSSVHVVRLASCTGILILAVGCSAGGSGGSSANQDGADVPTSSTAQEGVHDPTASAGARDNPTDGDTADTPGNSESDPDGLANPADDESDPDDLTNPADSTVPTTTLVDGPLTPAPDRGDEPLRQDRRFNSSATLPIVENPLRPLPRPWSDISEEEFAAGAPEPVLIAPADHDPATNRPPFFPSLENVTIVAGETFELHLAPIDPDGGVAGQYLKELYPGASYIDNFDTTRTFRWRPLEPDVGIRDFTVYTVDPDEPALRVRYTIRIKVIPPNDPSSIENFRPGIDRIEPQLARVGDPVVLEVKGTDRNGTVPRLEIIGAPPGTTFMQHRRDPRIRVVRFVPEVSGPVTLQLIAHDAVDPELTHSKSVTIDVRDAADFDRPGQRLRDLADARDFQIGFASTSRPYHRADGGLYRALAAAEFNLVTPENSMKWDKINPLPGVYDWADADNLVAWAKAYDLKVHGHTLVWYTQLPTWIKQTPLATRQEHMREFIERVLNRYADDVDLWDVVNESLDQNGGLRRNIWLDAMGPDYIDIAFRYAREYAPDATLLYNDYDIAWHGPKADGLFRLLDELKAANTPIDGVGFQVHIDADFDRFDELADNLAEVASRDLDVYITELDVSIRNGQTEAQQAAVFRGVLSACLAQARCKALQTWGYTDRYSWRIPFTPLLLDADYQAKPAYRAMQQRLGQN